MAPARDPQRVFLRLQVVLRDGLAGMQQADVDPGQRHLGRQRHLHVGQAQLCGAGIQRGGIGAGAGAAGQVGLPAGVQPGGKAVGRALRRRAAALRRCRGAHAGQQPRRCHVGQRARLAQRRHRGLHRGAGAQRVFDQRAEFGVAKALPPGGQPGGGRGLLRRGGAPARRQLDGGRRLALGRRRRHARGQRERQTQREHELASRPRQTHPSSFHRHRVSTAPIWRRSRICKDSVNGPPLGLARSGWHESPQCDVAKR